MTETHPRKQNYFFSVAYALLACVLVGFAPTFYLRMYFDVPEIPWSVYVHGLVLTTWFVWLAAQVTTIKLGKLSLHRSMGAIGAGIAVLVVLSGLSVALGLGPRLLEKYGNIDSDFQRIAGVVWGNIGMLVAFSVLVALAISYRRTPETHKRLMLIASFGISLPAFARIARFEFIDVFEPLFTIAALFLLLLATALYDKIKDGKIHRATLLGGGGLIACLVVFGFIVANTTFGHDFVMVLE